LVKRSSQRLAINRDALTAKRRCESIDPVVLRGKELACIEPTKDSPERIVTWHAVLQVDVAAKPTNLCLGESFDVRPSAPQMAAV
jgi:hypothetical protein